MISYRRFVAPLLQFPVLFLIVSFISSQPVIPNRPDWGSEEVDLLQKMVDAQEGDEASDLIQLAEDEEIEAPVDEEAMEIIE